jgi:hypothetical protein
MRVELLTRLQEEVRTKRDLCQIANMTHFFHSAYNPTNRLHSPYNPTNRLHSA